tara:strand:- start:684 stop:887 length:204 start_codon:yes stop_codon:yes gene_type:complete
MNDKTLAEQLAGFVKILELRRDQEEFGTKASHEYGVARNLVSQAITNVKWAAKHAAREAGAIKGVSK